MLLHSVTLAYDRIAGHETDLVFVLSTADISILWEPSVGNY